MNTKKIVEEMAKDAKNKIDALEIDLEKANIMESFVTRKSFKDSNSKTTEILGAAQKSKNMVEGQLGFYKELLEFLQTYE